MVSAPGKRSKDDEKVTDMLYACNALAQQGLTCKPVFKKISDRYTSILDELGIEKKPFVAVLEEVRQMIDAGFGAEYAASRGEYLSARMIAAYLGWDFLDADPYIVINPDGTVHEQSYENLRKVLKKKGRSILFPVSMVVTLKVR